MQCLRKYDIINVDLSVCLSVYAGIVSERMDIIVEIFGQPGRAIILGFIAPPPLQSFKRNPYSGGALNTRVWENFYKYRHLYRKWYKTGPWLLRNINRKF